MKPRNLVSNSPEQLIYARLFVEEPLSWFYETKEGAWDAFEKDPQRWRPNLNKRPKDFQVANRRKYRRIDNEDLAQAWLAFIGFSAEAANDKKSLFDSDKGNYSLIFKNRTLKHGCDYDSIVRAKSEARQGSPDHHLLLVAYLLRELAEEITPSASENRLQACTRLNIEPNQPKTVLDVELNKDDDFILNQALKSMSLLFTEFVGFVFFRALDDKLHDYGPHILNNYSFCLLACEYEMEKVKKQIDTEQFEPDDLMIVLWLAFVDTVRDMLIGDWGKSYRAAPVRIRFIFSKETRERLYRAIQSTNDFMKKRSLQKTWAIGVAEGEGLFDFVRNCLRR